LKGNVPPIIHAPPGEKSYHSKTQYLLWNVLWVSAECEPSKPAPLIIPQEETEKTETGQSEAASCIDHWSHRVTEWRPDGPPCETWFCAHSDLCSLCLLLFQRHGYYAGEPWGTPPTGGSVFDSRESWSSAGAI